MTTREFTIESGGKMSIFLALPTGAGPFPGVLVAHHRDGVDEFTRKACERLAENGFVAVAPNLYHRRPDAEDRLESRKFLVDAEIVADLNATVARMQQMPELRGQALGVIGHCMGGRITFLGAASNTAFKAAVVLYGGGIFQPWGEGGPAPFALAGKIKCPVQGFFGKEDQNPSPADVAKISAELTRLKVRHDFRSYDGAGHAFQNFTNADSYREQQSEDAWSRFLPFLRTELKAA